MRKITLILLLFSYPLVGVSGDYDKDLFEKNPAVVDLLPESDSELKFYIPGFLPWSVAELGVGDISATVDIPLDELLKNLDMIMLLGLEGRKGKIGFILEGMYLDLGVGGNTPARLLSSAHVSFDQLISEATGTYRIFESDRGFVEFLAGAKIYSVGSTLTLRVDQTQSAQISREISNQIVSRTTTAVKQEVQSRLPGILASLPNPSANLSSRATSASEDRIDRTLAAVAPLIERRIHQELDSDRRIGDGGLAERIAGNGRIRKQVRDLLRAQLESRIEDKRADGSAIVAADRAAARKKAKKAVDKAERKLANTINSEINSKLNNQSVSGSKTWADPFIGLRGKYQINEDIYFVARGDYGGFGINSNQTYNLYGAFGAQLKENIFAEVGVRSVGFEYQDGNFSYDGTFTGPFIGTIIRF